MKHYSRGRSDSANEYIRRDYPVNDFLVEKSEKKEKKSTTKYSPWKKKSRER